MKSQKFLALFLCLGLIAGCSGMQKQKTSATPGSLEPQAVLKFSDVPVPNGFRFMAAESYSFESSGLRIGLLKYEGKADADQVVNFYRDQMPMYNWRLLNTVEYGERMLNFDREQETCIITLNPKGSAVYITISVGPKAQGTKKAQKPVK